MGTVKVVDDKDLLIKKVKEYYVQVYKSHRRKKVYEGGLPRNIDFAGLKNLAIAEKMPEAIFMMMCYKEGQEKLKNVYPKEILSLFGDSEYSIKDIGANYETTLAPIKKKTGLGKEIEKYINNLLGGFEYLIDDSSSQIEKLTGAKGEIDRIIRIYQNWEATRHTMIFGKATPYYDDTKAFDRIVNDILPIATRDIWEDVYSYFNDKNKPHLPEHVKIIKRMYKSYISINKEK